jgi:signal transduction histidine kinase
VLTWLTMLMIVFELWYGVAYGYAYLQTRQPLLWFQVAQAVFLIALLGYITFTIANAGQINLLIIIALMVIALAFNLLWRQGVRSTNLAQSYPRGIVDILGFRRPAADLKRRVRSK